MLVQGPIRRIAIATAVRICAISKPSILLNHNHTCGMAYCASLQRAYVPVKSSSVQCDYSRMLHTSSSYSAKVVPYLLADIGEGIAEATILEWHVKEGDHVNQFDPICEVASDKANVDISSRFDGVIKKLHYEAGDAAAVGKPLLDIEVDDTDASGHEESEAEDTVSSIAHQSHDEGLPAAPSDSNKILMTPAVRRLVRENSVPIGQVKGTGKNGRVLKEDVIDFIEKAKTLTKHASEDTGTNFGMGPSRTQVPIRGLPEDEIRSITGFQAAMAKSMTAALKVPHFSYADERRYDESSLYLYSQLVLVISYTAKIQVDELIKSRSLLKRLLPSEIRLSYLPFIIKAASLALEKHPILNSHVVEDCSSIVLKATHNIGVAMDTPSGLLVPNVKAVNLKSIFEIARDLNELQDLGACGKLKTEHLSGGTFTLSNIGIVGGTYLGPVIVVPQVAIGAIGRIRRVPRFDEGDNVVPCNIMEMSFSADHRVIDGVTIANFFNEMKQLIENPHLFLASLK
eukprot:gene3773-6296_t